MAWGPAPESAATAEAWLEQHGRAFGHYLNGAWTAPGDGERFETINPATSAVLARVAQGSKDDVNAAVAARGRHTDDNHAARTPWDRRAKAPSAKYAASLTSVAHDDPRNP